MDNSNKKKYKLAIISPVPFYYHIPFYQKLSDSSEIDLTVFYCSDETIHGREVEKTYCTTGKIMEEEYLLNGYKHKFLRNYSPVRSFLNWPFGLINFGIWNEIKKGKYDMVVLEAWANITWWITFLACLWFKTPFSIMTDSNISSETTKSSFKINLKKILLGKFLFKNAAAFLTSGTANERYFKFYGVPEKKMGRIHFSSGYDWFIAHAEKNKSRREGIRKSFGVKENDFVLLYVGRLAKEKLVLSLLHAYNLVNYPNKKLFFVGDGPMRREMDNTIKQYEIKEVYFLGFHPRQNLCNFYTMADTLILPSKDETWGIVVNEAMCFELPIIVSNRVGVAADLVKDNYNGFISKVGDINALSAAIKKIIDMPASERALFGTRSKQMITSWINSSDDVQEVVKILDSLSNKT